MKMKFTAFAMLMGMLLFSSHLIADVNVLIIGSTHSYSEGGEGGVVHEKPFNPTVIATHLQGILSQDAAITGPVNVEFEDIYKTEVITAFPNLTSHCYSLAQHYMWPLGKAARMSNLRGEGTRQWDYIVLCNDPYLMANMPGVVAEGVKLIKEEVAKSANPAQVVLLAQWPESSSTFTATQFNEIAYRVGNSAGITMVPAGKAWNSYASKDTDTKHPTPRGEYLAASAIYSKLYNRSAKTSAYDYPAVGDAIADHALSVVQANAGVAQYSGTYTSFNPFQMKYLTKRVVSYKHTGTSTEIRTAWALDRLDDVQRIRFTDTGYAGVPGTRWDFNYGRGNDGWEPEKQYNVDSSIYDWVYGFPMHHNGLTVAPTSMPYGVDKQFNSGSYDDGTDLGIAYNMIRPNTREPDWPEAVRAIPIRLMWLKMREVSPGFNPLGDSTHMHPNLKDATAAFMYTLLSGRCPVEPEPAVATTSTTWMQWLGHKIGYETAWQMSHLTTRAPGFRVLPSATEAKTVTPTTKETMTVDFMNPPQGDVTVNISISNANAAVVGANQLVFTPQNYKTPQSVTVAGIPGSAASETFNVVFTTVSTDEVYNGLSDSWDYTTNRSAPLALTRVNKTTIQATAYQNLPVTINLNTAGATSSNTILAGPSGGTAAWSGSNVIYTPGSDFTGKDGFTFATNDAGTLSVGYVEITVSASIPNGMVSYRGNGNVGGAVPVDSSTYAQNATVTVLGNTGNLSRTGYNFNGWNAAADGSGANYNTGSTFTMGSSGVILYAKWISAPTYTVSYNANASNSGVVPSNQIKTDGVDLTLAANIGSLARNGYTFAGWNTLANGTGTNYAAGGIYSGNANITLFARWTPNNYTVTFNANGGGTPSPASKVVTRDSTYGTLATVSYPGYTFNGWFTAATGGTQILPTTTVNITGNQTLHAQWTAGTSYTVSYDANAADSGTVPASQTKVQDVALTLASNSGGLARAGYAFAGWNTVADGSGTAYASAASYTANAAAVLYAQWSPVTYAVTYSGNGSTGGTAPSNQAKTHGTNLTLSGAGTLVRTGYTFINWNTAANGSGTSYAAGASYSIDAAVTLHAQWTALPTYTVAYDGNGSTGGTVPSNQTKIQGINLTLSGAGTLVRTGYAFTNWNTAANGSGATYAAGASYSTDAAVTLYAQWAAVPTYTITYSGNGNTSGAAPSNQTKTQGINLTLSGAGTLVRTGFTFSNWNTAANGTGTSYAAGATYSIDAAVTLHAQWTINTYAVTYNGNGSTAGTAPSSQTKTHDISLTLATNAGNLTRTGYSFAGWNTATDGLGISYSEGSSYTTNAALALYAKWTPDNYTVTFDGNGGVTPTPSSKPVTFGSTYGTLASTSRTGYTFNGWFTAASGGAETTTATAVAVAADHTLHAQWTANTYPVNYLGNGNTSGTVPADQAKIHDINLALATNTGSLAKTGYTFTGWNTAANGSGTPYATSSTYSANAALTLHAQWVPGTSLTWDSNGTGAGQTNGAGDWGAANLWWNGTSNTIWEPAAHAIFGGSNTSGGAVTLAAPATAESITFNSFTSTYTIGTAGQTLTINSGINKTAPSGIVSIISPIAIGSGQTWANNSTNALTASSTVDNGGATLIIDGAGTINMTGVISGAGGIVKNGSGRFTFGASANANTYTGPTTINGGILSIANNSASLGGGNLTLNGGVLGFYWSAGLTRALGPGVNQVSIPGGESGFGGDGGNGPTINLGTSVIWGASGEGSATGHFNPGKFVLGSPDTSNAGLTTFSSAINMNGTTRTIVAPKGLSAGGNVSTISGAIGSGTGTAGLVKEGAGTLVLSAANTYTGPTTISDGTLRIGNNTAGTLNGGNYAGNISIASGANLQIWGTTAQILSGALSGAGGLQKAYGGSLTLSGPNTYTGRTSFLPQTTAGCTVNITSFNSINGGTPPLANSSLGAPTTIANGTIDIGSGGAQAGVTLSYTGPGETTDRVINFGFNGSASQTLTASGGGLLKFTGAMTSNAITSQSGKLILAGTGRGEITQALPALPSGGLTKNDGGTWTLGGANTYTGPTAITAGKLYISGDQSSATGNVSVAANATLGGTGTIGGDTTIAAGGKLEFNLSTAAGSHNPLDLITGKTLTFSGASELTITSTGGAVPGTYTLITGGNNIGGAAPATVNLPANWAATVSKSGNSLLLNVTSVGGAGSVDHFVISSVSSPQTVGTPITGITITAQDASNNTATSFNGTVTFGGTAGITGTTAPLVGGVLSGVSVTPLNAGSVLTLTVNDGAGHTGSTAFLVQSRYDAWAAQSFASPFTEIASTANPDGDSLNNLQEFAFGMDPSKQDFSTVTYVADGDVTKPGIPVIKNFAPVGQAADWRAVFARRKDHAASGLTYAAVFSADLKTWTSSAITPARLTGVSSAGAMEAVSVPYPATVPLQAGGSAAPKFFRIGISGN